MLHQSEFNFDPERGPMVFTPEYIEPEVQVTPYLVNKGYIQSYGKKGFFARFMNLPKMLNFTLDALEKTNLYLHDVHSLAKRSQGNISEVRQKVDGYDSRMQMIESGYENRINMIESRLQNMSGEVEGFHHRFTPIIEEKVRHAEEVSQNLIRSEVHNLKKELGALKKKDSMVMMLALVSLLANIGLGYLWYRSITGQSM